MKKILLTLLNLGLNFSLRAEILHVRKDKLKELNKEFRDSTSFLRAKQQQIWEERTNKLANYQAKVQEYENRKDLLPKEKEELERLEAELTNFILLQNEEFQKAALVFENKIDADIKEALKKLVSNVPILEGQFVLYGGRDITKELLDALNNKEVKKITPNFSSKIYTFDMEKFSSNFKGAKDIRKYIDQKIEEIKNKQKEFRSKINTKDFNQEEAEKTLRAMQNDLQTTNQVMHEKLANDLEKALNRVAVNKKIDAIFIKRATYSDTLDITDEIIKELEKNEEIKDVKSNNNSLIAFVNDEVVLNKYKKYEEKRKELSVKTKEFEKALEEKAGQIQKAKDNNKDDSKKQEIERLEAEFDQFRAMKIQQIQQFMKNMDDEVLNDIKAAAKIVGAKKKLELVVFKSKNNAAVLYAGQDITQDVLNTLSSK